MEPTTTPMLRIFISPAPRCRWEWQIRDDSGDTVAEGWAYGGSVAIKLARQEYEHLTTCRGPLPAARVWREVHP